MTTVGRVMLKGQIVEYGPATQIVRHPAHPYTREMLAAAPNADRALSRRQ